MALTWLVMVMALAAPAERHEWTFARDTSGWRPRVATVKLTREPGGPRPESAGALHVSGPCAEGWNYAASPARPLTAGNLYRLSAWLRVRRLGPSTPAPFLKCEFQSADPKQLGRAVTDAYDTGRLDTWQQLTVEFRLPTGGNGAWVAIEKGTSAPTEVDLLVAEVVLERIDRLTVYDRYRLSPLPAPLAATRGVHPRLYADEARFAALREQTKTTHRALWDSTRTYAERLLRNGPPADGQTDGSGDEQLWQREVGNAMPYLALCWRLTGERRWLDAAEAWATASCGYRTWGLGHIDGLDLATGHQLFGLALVYDWCFADLRPATRELIKATLLRRGGAMAEAGLGGQAWWRNALLQNHLWVNATGLAAAGLALWDEHEPALLWVGFALDRFRATSAALGPDGASHEGVGYWEYGVEYLLKFNELARALLGVNLYDRPWWRQTAAYGQYLATPRATWTRGSCIVDIADCPRGHWYGPDHCLRRLAAEYRDGHAQWLAEQIGTAAVDAPSARWLNLLWYDPQVAPQAPGDLPLLHHFADLGLVAARSDWSGHESLVVFKCGPALGHEATDRFAADPGSGHVHPDVNHLMVFGAGEWLVRDDGYNAKWTEQHNTLLIDGRGQVGEGQAWFNGAPQLARKLHPRVVAANAGPEVDLIASEGSAAYPPAAGLQQYRRLLLYVRRANALIVIDEVQLAAPRALELRLHTEARPVAVAANVVEARGPASRLRLENLSPDSRLTVAPTPLKGAHGHRTAELPGVRLSTTAAQWRQVTALSWSAAGAAPLPVTGTARGERWVFQVGQWTLTWPVGTTQVEVASKG